MPSFRFAQMADPQFGMYAAVSRYTDEDIERRRAIGLTIRKAEKPIDGFADETRLYAAAIEAANALSPDFVVMCGDMVDDPEDQAQLDEMFRVSSGLNPEIPLYYAPGNHDVGGAPTADSLALYRERFGADNYSFSHKETHFAVFNSSLAYNPSNSPLEWKRTKEFLSDDLSAAKRRGARHIVVFTHHPLFMKSADEYWDGGCIPEGRRDELLAILRGCGVSATFAGHLHRNKSAKDFVSGMKMVTTGAVGYPLGQDPSGFRMVRVSDEEIIHEFRALSGFQKRRR